MAKVNAVDYEKEIILNDDFSTDGTSEILKNYEKRCKALKIAINDAV